MIVIDPEERPSRIRLEAVGTEYIEDARKSDALEAMEQAKPVLL